LPETIGIFVLGCLAMALAAAVQGAVGFGSGLVAVGLLGAMIGVRGASIAVVLPSLVMEAVLFWQLRAHFKWDRILPVMISAVAAVPVGVFLLARLDRRVLELILGALMLATVCYSLLPALARRRWHPLYVGIPCGLLSGTITGTLSTGGPPLVAYVSAQRFDRFRYAASLQAMFIASQTVRVVELARRGLFDSQSLLYAAAGAVVMPLGVLVGLGVLRRISDRLLRGLVIAILLALALRYLL